MIFVVLPAYNEGPALERLLPRLIAVLQGYRSQIIVVDDGSIDQTATVVRKYFACGVRLEQHRQNRGLKEALRTGLRTALSVARYNDAIVTLDADDTHPPEIIPQMQQKIAAGCDIVVASRFVPGGKEEGLALYRKVLSRGAAWLIKSFFRIDGITDYSCGYRAYRAAFLAKGFDSFGPQLIDSTGFAVAAEILLKLSFLAPHCAEVPLDLRYDRKIGRSKLPLLKTIAGYLTLILKLKMAQRKLPNLEKTEVEI